MSFKHDVFISYPHLSNQDDASGHNGWVAKFHRRLKDRLSEALGRDARIWRDNKLKAGAVFGDEIRDRLRDSKVLLCILSPAYINSEWCLKELRAFYCFAEESGNLSVANQSRIMTAIKTFVPQEQHPAELRGSLYSEFYKKSEDWGSMPRALGQEAGEYGYEEYKLEADKVVWSIKDVVESLGHEDALKDVERTIYLAEMTSDKENHRDKIKAELEARDFIVLQDEPLAKQKSEDYENSVRRNLQRSFMSIHLMGRAYGMILEDADKSIIHLQNELAAEHSQQEERFKRLIWIPPNLENPQGSQTGFLDNLRLSAEAQFGAELYDKLPFEEFKTRIIQLIKRMPTNPPPDNLIRIYLMCDKDDDDTVNPVGQYLFEKGYEVIPPPEEDQRGQVIKYHRDNLLRCDATLIVFGKTKLEWVMSRHNDAVETVKGLGRKNEIPCRAILRTDPETKFKNRLFTRAAKLLPPCYKGVTSDELAVSLNVFIKELELSLHN
jgi:hypothetical protein